MHGTSCFLSLPTQDDPAARDSSSAAGAGRNYSINPGVLAYRVVAPDREGARIAPAAFFECSARIAAKRNSCRAYRSRSDILLQLQMNTAPCARRVQVAA